ncbi:electron transport complex subunit RsxC [Colwelliaceae bacterium 6471]
MESVIERITRGHFWKFHGGIHPPEQKQLTNNKPIRQIPIPAELVIPLQQHIGHAGELLVKVGDKVLKGQPLTQHTTAMSVPIHAPTSGTITDIKNAVIAHPSGLSDRCVILAPDGEDTWRERQVCNDVNMLSHDDLISRIASAGIAGMGGAGFPAHIKASSQKKINYLIINAAECEPYITADDLLIRENSPTIIQGIDILAKLLKPTQILIGIEDNKPEAAKVLMQACENRTDIKVCVLPTKYPTGGEKQLIQVLTGQEVPSGVIPVNMGIVMQNVATCFAIAEAVIHDIPLIRRVVTVSGQALEKPQNVWALLGTPVKHLLDCCDFKRSSKPHLIMGGPMMGYSLPTDAVPVVKTTNCILAPSDKEISQENKEVECIRCGQCAEACPAQLLPQELQWSAKAKDHDQLQKLNLFDCIECGACAYVCPSQIPLVHYYRVAKAEIRQKHLLEVKAEHAKARFEARKVRLEKEKLAREEKHRKAAEARRARMNAGTPEGENAKSAVAAALARVKAKKAQSGIADVETSAESAPISPVAAAVARAKAKKLAAKKKAEQALLSTDTPSSEASLEQKAPLNANNATLESKENQASIANVSDKPSDATISKDGDEAISKPTKSAQVAKAVARAKAKKRAKEMQSEKAPENANKSAESKVTDSNATLTETATETEKASKTIREEKVIPNASSANKNNETKVSVSSETPDDTNDTAVTEPSKQDRIKAAIAKAKAKQQSKPKADLVVDDLKASANNDDSKEKRIALAIEKAKAKKQQRTEST